MQPTQHVEEVDFRTMADFDMEYVLSFPLDDEQKKQLQDEVWDFLMFFGFPFYFFSILSIKHVKQVKKYLASSSSNDDDVLVVNIAVAIRLLSV